MLKRNARTLRKQMTDAERALWKHLRLRQIGGQKFRRQHPIGPYIVDFVCLEKRFIIEVDGGHHASQMDEDAKRTAWLHAQGFRVLRLWNHDVLTATEAVMEQINEALICSPPPPPQSSPPKGGGRGTS